MSIMEIEFDFNIDSLTISNTDCDSITSDTVQSYQLDMYCGANN